MEGVVERNGMEGVVKRNRRGVSLRQHRRARADLGRVLQPTKIRLQPGVAPGSHGVPLEGDSTSNRASLPLTFK